MRVVISEPERRAASTTTTPTARPEIRAVAAGEIVGPRRMLEGHFGDCCTVLQNRCSKLDMLAPIDVIVPAGEHRDGASRKTRPVRGGIDATRYARRDNETGFAEVAGEPLGDLDPSRRSVAGADHRDHRAAQRRVLTTHRHERRRIVDHLQAPGYSGSPSAQKEVPRERAALISRSASAGEQMRPPPPRRARFGSAASARRALPN
jgi:hypothetical protein